MQDIQYVMYIRKRKQYIGKKFNMLESFLLRIGHNMYQVMLHNKVSILLTDTYSTLVELPIPLPTNSGCGHWFLSCTSPNEIWL